MDPVDVVRTKRATKKTVRKQITVSEGGVT